VTYETGGPTAGPPNPRVTRVGGGGSSWVDATLTGDDTRVRLVRVAETQSYALGPGEGRSIDLGDSFTVTVLADESRTGGVVSVLETQEPSGLGPPMHVHHDCAEAFYVLEGEYLMYLENDEATCPAGSFIFIPRGVRHGFRTGDVPSRKLNFYLPASMIGYFDDLASALRREGVTEDELTEIASVHAMEIVGPPSDSYL